MSFRRLSNRAQCRLLGALVALAGLALPAAVQAETLVVDGVPRTYEIFIPASAVQPAPAVVLLHGGGGSADQLRDHLDFDDLAASAGVVAVYPDAVDKLWNDGRFSPALADQQAAAGDDVGFIVSLVDMLAANGVIDPRRVAVAGISNGGMMTQRLACEAPDRFAAFTVVVANMATGIECPGGAAVPMLFMHGTEDPLIPYAGGDIAPQFGGSRGTAYSVPDTMALWAARNGCSGRTTQAVLNSRPLDGTSAAIYAYTGCRAPLMHVLIDGMGHAWPGQRQGLIGLVTGRASREIDGNLAVLDFASAQFAAQR